MQTSTTTPPTLADFLASAARVKGMPLASTLAMLLASHGDWCRRMDGETARQWARRLLTAAGNLV